MRRFGGALLVAVVAAAAPLASAQDEEPFPMPGLPSDCCEAPPRCLEFSKAPRLTVHPRRANAVAVKFELARVPVGVRAVRVQRRPARIHRLSGRDGRAYRATLRRAGLRTGRLKVGRRYLVRIDVDLAPTTDDCGLALAEGTPPGPRDCYSGCTDTFDQYVRLRPRPSR